MPKPAIVCVDDQREVLASLLHDLHPLHDDVQLVECESAAEALEVINDLDSEGAPIALVISDQVMPEQSGVKLLTQLRADARFPYLKKLLLTGLATHEDTIEAINQAQIDRYIAKPWRAEALIQVVKELFTHFLFDEGLDFREFQDLVDSDVVLERSKWAE